MFQSTHPVGCDRMLGHSSTRITVSIHASRGMRHQVVASAHGSPGFNPRIPWDATDHGRHLGLSIISFNPRIPWDATKSGIFRDYTDKVSIHASRGMRPALDITVKSNKMFQSTHPVGCDRINWWYLVCHRVSIHASRGMRLPMLKIAFP